MDIIKISLEHDLETFLRALFPERWAPVIRVIMESGASFALMNEQVAWAPRWSKIPLTVKGGNTRTISALKECMYRAHDALHQLWGLPPVPAEIGTLDHFLFKRAQMCGEVVVLFIEEFLLGQHLWESLPDLRGYIDHRRAVPMMRTVFQGRSMQEIVGHLDDILHCQLLPQWDRENADVVAFANYYVPMFERDRAKIDHNLGLLRRVSSLHFDMTTAPVTRYDASMDGRELIVWMIDDFLHILRSGATIDRSIQQFNKGRRAFIRLPPGWVTRGILSHFDPDYFRRDP